MDIMNRASTADIQERINARFSSVYDDRDGKYQPYVCLVCDEFISPGKMQHIGMKQLYDKGAILKQDGWNKVSSELGRCYQIKAETCVNYLRDNEDSMCQVWRGLVATPYGLQKVSK
jgi:hypothetical protein